MSLESHDLRNDSGGSSEEGPMQLRRNPKVIVISLQNLFHSCANTSSNVDKDIAGGGIARIASL